MKDLVQHAIAETLGNSRTGEVITMSAEQSSEVDDKINEKMREVVRESNYRNAKSDYDASRTYVW